MKKTLLFATALMFGTAAMAQDMGAQAPAGPNAQSAAPDTTMPATTDTPMAAPAPTDPAAAPAPMAAPAPAADAPMAANTTPTASTTDYPPCSRTVTDKCVSGKKMASKAKSHKKRAM